MCMEYSRSKHANIKAISNQSKMINKQYLREKSIMYARIIGHKGRESKRNKKRRDEMAKRNKIRKSGFLLIVHDQFIFNMSH